MDEYLAMIKAFAGNFAPQNFALCQGQTLNVSQNTALFSLLGTTYGGNGQTTFNLPDLRGRAPIGVGQGNGLSSVNYGQTGGAENVTLAANQMPSHSHTFNVAASAGNTSTPGTTTYLSQGASTGSGPNATVAKMYTSAAPGTSLGGQTVGNAGGNQPFSVRDPYLAITYVIVTAGLYPSRS